MADDYLTAELTEQENIIENSGFTTLDVIVCTKPLILLLYLFVCSNSSSGEQYSAFARQIKYSERAPFMLLSLLVLLNRSYRNAGLGIKLTLVRGSGELASR